MVAAAQTGGSLQHADDFTATGRFARERGATIMLAFTQASCQYCRTAKRDHLVPMHNDNAWRDRVLIREIDIDSHAPLRDFEGRTLSRKAFSQRYQVTRVPTVIVVDHGGAPLAEPIVGLLTADFYRLYLEQAVEEGLYRLRHARRPS